MVRIVAPTSKVIKYILNFVGIPSREEVVVSLEVSAKTVKESLQFTWASTVAFRVRDLEHVV